MLFASHYPLTRSYVCTERPACKSINVKPKFALMNGCIVTGQPAGNVNFYYEFVDGLTKRVALYLAQQGRRRTRRIASSSSSPSAVSPLPHIMCVCASACLHASKSHPANQRHCQTATTCPSSLPPFHSTSEEEEEGEQVEVPRVKDI